MVLHGPFQAKPSDLVQQLAIDGVCEWVNIGCSVTIDQL